MKTITYNPETHKLVPKDLADDTIDAACDAGGLYRVEFVRAWDAALDAAPEAPEQAGTQQVPHSLAKWAGSPELVETGNDWQQGYENARAWVHVQLTANAAAPQPEEPQYSDSTPHLHVGESAFESWLSSYDGSKKGTKQLLRDAYAAGMGDPLVCAKAPQQEEREECDCPAEKMPFGRCCKSQASLGQAWHGAAQWLRNNYQDHPNLTSLCEAMVGAAPQGDKVAPWNWRMVLPGGLKTDKWDSARVGDYNNGWNAYRTKAVVALESLEAHQPPPAKAEGQEQRSEDEPVAWGFHNTALTGRNRWMMLREQVPENDQYGGAMWTPLYAAPQPAKDDNWQQYAKPDETAQQCIERHRAEQDALLELLKQARTPAAPPQDYALGSQPITEEMHRAACKVLLRADGLDGLPQRMLDAMLAASAAKTEGGA